MSTLTRRQVLAALAASTGSAAAVRLSPTFASTRSFFERRKLPIGVQLYSVWEAASKDLDATLQIIASIGYRTVELAGYLGRTPLQWRQALDRAGLRCTSAHVETKSAGPEPSLSGDLASLAAGAHRIGIDTIVMADIYVPERLPQEPHQGEDYVHWLTSVGSQLTVGDWKFNADFLNRCGDVLKTHGLHLAYHNHNMEFAPIGTTTGLDILLDQTDPALVQFEMDTGWVAAAGHDPVALLRSHPHRFRLLHVKDVDPSTSTNFEFQAVSTDLGKGVLNWSSLLSAAYQAGIREFFVEHEADARRSPVEAIRHDFAYLKSVIA